MNVLKVMGCESFNYGSQERFLVKMAKRLNANGNSFIIVYENYPKNSRFIEDAETYGATFLKIGPKKYSKIYQSISPLTSIYYRFFALDRMVKVKKIIDNYEIDIVDAYFPNSLYSIFVGFLSGKITIMTASNPFLQSATSKGRRINLLGKFKTFFMHIFPTYFMDKQICISGQIQDEYLACGVYEEKLECIRSGIDLQRYNPQINGDKAKIEFSIDNTDFVIGFTGRLEAQKNLFFLIDIIFDVSRKIHNLKVIIVGSGSQLSKLRKKCKELGLKDKVIFTGRRIDIPNIAINFDLFLLPSLFEGMSGSLLEAMGLGLVCVTNNLEQSKEVIDNGVDGFLCSNKNKEEYVDTIFSVYKNPNLREEIGKNARKKICNKFSVQRRVDESEKVYNLLYKDATNK